MNKIIAIALREYLAAVKTKAFVISVVLLPVMLALMTFLRTAGDRMVGESERTFAVIDHVGVLDDFSDAVAEHNRHAAGAGWHVTKAGENSDADLSADVRAGRLAGYLTIDPKTITLHTTGAGDLSFRAFADRTLNGLLRQKRLRAGGLDPAVIDPLLVPIPLTIGPLSHLDKTTGETIYDQPPNDLASIGVPLVLTLVMFIVVIISAIPMMQGVIEEKQLRIAEVLLASVRPFELMSGKLLGLSAISGTLVIIYTGGTVIAALVGEASYVHLLAQSLSLTTIGWYLVFQVLAVFMFGSLYIAIGASCTDMREAQALLLPLNLLLMLPMLLLANVLEHPGSSLAKWASLFPTAAPFLTMARVATPPGIPWWQAAIPAGIVLISTIICIWAGGRIFRVGMMAGQGATWRTLLSWIFK